MKKTLALATLVMAVIFSAAPFAQATTLYEHFNDNSENGQHVVCGSIITGQAITVTSAHPISSVSLKLFRNGKGVGDLIVNVVPLNYVVPELNNVLASGSINANAVPTAKAWVTVPLTQVTLQPGRYAILAYYPDVRYNGWNGKQLFWCDSYVPELIGGLPQALYSADGGATWSFWSTIVQQYEVWG